MPAGGRLHTEDDVARNGRVALALVVQRAVHLHVRHARAHARRDPDQRLDLSADRLDQLAGRDVHRHAPESFAVGISRMRADRDLVPDSELDRGAHRVLVPSVPTARDVRARNERHERHIGAGALSKIAIEVDRACHALSRLTSGHHARYQLLGALESAAAGGTGSGVARERAAGGVARSGWRTGEADR